MAARMRWYNPALQEYEWREFPKRDDKAEELLANACLDTPYAEDCLRVYRKWRELYRGRWKPRMAIAAALIRSGEAALRANYPGRGDGDDAEG